MSKTWRQFCSSIALIAILSGGFFALPTQVDAATCACYFSDKEDEDCKEVFVADGGTQAHCEAECKKNIGKTLKRSEFADGIFSGGISVSCKLTHTTLKEKKEAEFVGPPVAATASLAGKKEENKLIPKLNVEIPGLTLSPVLDKGGVLHANFIGEYVAGVYNYILLFAITIAIAAVMVGGLRYAFGGVSKKQISDSKKQISNAVIGLVLLLGVTTILQLTNPRTLELEALPLEVIDEVTIEADEHHTNTEGDIAASDPGAVEKDAPPSASPVSGKKLTASGVPFSSKIYSYPCVPGKTCPPSPRSCAKHIKSDAVKLPGVNISHKYLGLLDCNISNRTRKKKRSSAQISMIILHEGFPNKNVKGMIGMWVRRYHYGKSVKCKWNKKKNKFNKPYCTKQGERFRTPPGKVPIGSHFAVTPGGSIYQLGDPLHIYNHCCSENKISIGIDLNWIGRKKARIYPDEQYKALAKLIKALSKKYGISINDSKIKAHCELGKHSDPPYFNWAKLGKHLGVSMSNANHKARRCRWTDK